WPGVLLSRDGTCKEDQRETNRQDSSDAVGTCSCATEEGLSFVPSGARAITRLLTLPEWTPARAMLLQQLRGSLVAHPVKISLAPTLCKAKSYMKVVHLRRFSLVPYVRKNPTRTDFVFYMYEHEEI